MYFICKNLPITRQKPLPIVYHRMHRSFFAVIFWFVQLSPKQKWHPHCLQQNRCLSLIIPLLTIFSVLYLLDKTINFQHYTKKQDIFKLTLSKIKQNKERVVELVYSSAVVFSSFSSVGVVWSVSVSIATMSSECAC